MEYWWWFNNLMDKSGITRDLEEAKTRGTGNVFGGIYNRRFAPVQAQKVRLQPVKRFDLFPAGK